MKSAEEMMEAMKKMSMPTEEHNMLKSYAGMWTADSKMWATPGSEPKMTKGTSTNKIILGGRYLEQKYVCKDKGETFEGQGLMGYDNMAKKFVSSWIDTMSTGLFTEEGKMDPATKMIEMKGKMMDPTTGKEMATRSTLTPVEKNQYTYAMYANDNTGKEFKMMEIVFMKPMMGMKKK